MKIGLINGWELLLGAAQFPDPKKFVQTVQTTIQDTAGVKDTFFDELKLALTKGDLYTVEIKAPDSKRITIKYVGDPVGFENDDEEFYMNSLDQSRVQEESDSDENDEEDFTLDTRL